MDISEVSNMTAEEANKCYSELMKKLRVIFSGSAHPEIN